MRMAKGKAAAFWREKIERFDAGVVSVKEFCQREGLAVQSFYQWRRKFANEASNLDSNQIRTTGQRWTPKFVPVAIVNESSGTLEVVLTCGATIRVHRGCDLSLLRSIVTSLSGAASC